MKWIVDDKPLDPRWPQLLAAARVWRATLPPMTVSTKGPTQRLVEAVDAFDEPPAPQ